MVGSTSTSQTKLDMEKLGDMAMGLFVGVFIACGLMSMLFLLYGAFIMIWMGAGLMWALVYLIGIAIGGGAGVKHFS